MKHVELHDVYMENSSKEVLYQLLGMRDKAVNISHREMPSWGSHSRFVDSHPYRAWYLIRPLDGSGVIGQIYLTRLNEIGLQLYPAWQRRGYGKAAIELLIARHGPGRYLANVAAGNIASQDFFVNGMGFQLLQHTYELVVAPEC